MKKTIVVVGAGKGLGNNVARKFGKNDFRVILVARSEKALREYEEELLTDGIETYSEIADAANVESLDSAFSNIKEKFGAIDVLVYNVGITTPDAQTQITSKELMKRYQVDVASAYHCVQLVISDEFSKKNGTIIFTGGGLALYPTPEYTPISMDKAALRNLAFILNNELGKKGIFVGTVTIAGAIAPDTDFAPELIAEKYWDLYTERKTCEIIYLGKN